MHRAALGPVAVDALGRGDPAHLVHDPCIARYMAMAASRPAILVSLASDAGNSAEHQPPLRPDAPNPAMFASQTATRRPGCALAR